jgi:hypothetical protein
MKHSRVYAAIFVLTMSFAAVAAQAQNQQQPAPAGSMNGMDMSKPAANGNTNNANSGKPMDMSHGDSMDMSHCMMNMGSGDGKQMNMGNGSDAGKPMDMSHCMEMMKGGKGNLANIPPGTLRVAFGDKSTDWTPATLASLPHTTVTVHNEHTKADETYSGVPLMDLLTRLGVSDQPHGKYLRFYLAAIGSDGYETVYSIGEVNPNVHDAAVIVADTENGKPLIGDGPLKLVDTRDKHPARWVRNLVAIKVQVAE